MEVRCIHNCGSSWGQLTIMILVWPLLWMNLIIIELIGYPTINNDMSITDGQMDITQMQTILRITT